MKSCRCILVVLAAIMVAAAGCSKSEEKVDTAPLENSFATAEPTTKTSADRAVSAIKAGDYAGALGELKTLAGNAKLTPEQQQAIKDVMAKVQNAITSTATQVQGEAGKAVENLQKSLPK